MYGSFLSLARAPYERRRKLLGVTNANKRQPPINNSAVRITQDSNVRITQSGDRRIARTY